MKRLEVTTKEVAEIIKRMPLNKAATFTYGANPTCLLVETDQDEVPPELLILADLRGVPRPGEKK